MGQTSGRRGEKGHRDVAARRRGPDARLGLRSFPGPAERGWARPLAVTNTELFERAPIPRACAQLIIPTVIGSLVTVTYSMADTFFVGALNSDVQSAAVSVAAPALLALNAVNNLFGVGGSSVMSRALGRGEPETVRQSASFGFYGAVFSGLLLSLLSALFLTPLMRVLGATDASLEATAAYLRWAVCLGATPTILNVVLGYLVRSEGAALHASLGTMSGCLLNIALDPVFIMPWGLNMGAAGAGCATFLSNCVACGYFFVLLRLRRDRTYIKLHPRYFRPKGYIVRGVFAVGVPAAIQNLLNVTGQAVLNNFIKGYGEAAMAALGIAHKIQMVPVQVALGASQGVMPLVGYAYANGNKKRFRGAISFLCRIMVPMMAAVAAVCWLWPQVFVSWFHKNPEVIAYGSLFLRGFAAAMPFVVLDFLAVGVFQSVGMGGQALVFALLRKIVLEIPAIVVLGTVFHAQGIAYAGAVAECVLAAAGMWMLRRILRRFPQCGAGEGAAA